MDVRERISRDVRGGYPLEVPGSEHAETSARLRDHQTADGQALADHAEGRIAVRLVVRVHEYPHVVPLRQGGSLATGWLAHVPHGNARSARDRVTTPRW